MKHRIFTFLKESLLTLRFLEGTMLCCGIYFLGVLVWWHHNSFLYVFGAATTFSSFTFLFPICAALPYALRYRENRKSHLDAMILQRCSVRRYLNTMFMRTAVSGFAAMALGTVLFICLIPVFFPNAVISYEMEEGGIIIPYMRGIAKAGNWPAYFGFYVVLMGISGVFWSVLALTVSAWIDNIYAITIFPILFLTVMDYLARPVLLCTLTGIMIGDHYFCESWMQMLSCSLATFGSMSLACYILFVQKGRRNARES